MEQLLVCTDIICNANDWILLIIFFYNTSNTHLFVNSYDLSTNCRTLSRSTKLNWTLEKFSTISQFSQSEILIFKAPNIHNCLACWEWGLPDCQAPCIAHVAVSLHVMIWLARLPSCSTPRGRVPSHQWAYALALVGRTNALIQLSLTIGILLTVTSIAK